MRLRLPAALVVVAISVLFPWNAESHSPYQPTVLFFHTNFPDRPISEFAKGRLGIIQPEWSRGYIVVAYRYLSGKPLSRPEQLSFLDNSELHPPAALKPFPPDRWSNWPKENNGPQQWVKARAKYRKDKPPSPESEDWWEFTYGERCQSDSFQTAIKTLDNRAKKYGVNSPQLQDWISAQDEVYLNCSEQRGKQQKSNNIPKPLPATSDSLARADRTYQIAAAHFYAGDEKDAISQFEAIGRDASSPWREYGAYVAARMVLRNASPDDLSTFDPKKLAEADERLAAAAFQISSPGLKKSIEGLREYIALRLHPDGEYVRLARRIAEGTSGDNLGQDIVDIGYLSDRIAGDPPDFPNVDRWSEQYRNKAEEWRNQHFIDIRKQRSQSDLADWVFTIEWQSPSSSKHARHRWTETKSLPWLVAALINCKGNDPEAAALIEAGAAIKPESAAFATVVYHRARLMREQGNASGAASVVDQALQNARHSPVSAVNLLRAERMLDASSLKDFLTYLPRQPLGFDNGTVTQGEDEFCYGDKPSQYVCEKNVFESGTPRRLLPQIDSDAALILNKGVRLSDLIWLAQAPPLPENVRKRLAPAAWVRSVLLDRPQEAAVIAKTAVQLRPELQPYIAQYEFAKTAQERHFLAAFAIAHFPALSPFVHDSNPRITRFDFADNYRDNWWSKCGLPWECNKWRRDNSEVRAPIYPAFYSAHQKEDAHSEFQKISDLGACGDWLSNTLIDWAKNHPADERSPEALHYAMRVIRFSADGSAKRSREVYALLHKKYPRTEWAKKTRYWY